jgi:hypothetical protein
VLENVTANRTTVVIAHKLPTVWNADNTAVIFGGVIVGQGNREKLTSLDNVYTSLVRAQDLGHVDGQDSSEEGALQSELRWLALRLNRDRCILTRNLGVERLGQWTTVWLDAYGSPIWSKRIYGTSWL